MESKRRAMRERDECARLRIEIKQSEQEEPERGGAEQGGLWRGGRERERGWEGETFGLLRHSSQHRSWHQSDTLERERERERE